MKLLPATQDNRALRHAVEARHESFANAEAVALAREAGVALITGADAEYSVIADPLPISSICASRAPPRTTKKAIRKKPSTPGPTASSPMPKAASPTIFPASPCTNRKARDVFAFVISGFKEKNPAAAMALIERVKKRAG